MVVESSVLGPISVIHGEGNSTLIVIPHFECFSTTLFKHGY